MIVNGTHMKNNAKGLSSVGRFSGGKQNKNSNFICLNNKSGPLPNSCHNILPVMAQCRARTLLYLFIS